MSFQKTWTCRGRKARGDDWDDRVGQGKGSGTAAGPRGSFRSARSPSSPASAGQWSAGSPQASGLTTSCKNATRTTSPWARSNGVASVAAGGTCPAGYAAYASRWRRKNKGSSPCGARGGKNRCDGCWMSWRKPGPTAPAASPADFGGGFPPQRVHHIAT